MTAYELIGRAVVWLLAVGTACLAGLLIFDLIGYIVGAFRHDRHGVFGKRLPWWRLVLVGAQRWLRCWRLGGGWYVSRGGQKLYEQGFRRAEPDE